MSCMMGQRVVQLTGMMLEGQNRNTVRVPLEN